MGPRLHITFVSVLAGLLFFAGVAWPVQSYRSYQDALKSDFRVPVKAEVLSLTVADPDEGLASLPSSERFSAPVVHFNYSAPGDEAVRSGQLLITFSKYWSRDPEQAKKRGEELHPIGSFFEIYLSEGDASKYALRPSAEPKQYYLVITPLGFFLFLMGIALMRHRSRFKREWTGSKSGPDRIS